MDSVSLSGAFDMDLNLLLFFNKIMSLASMFVLWSLAN